MTIIITTFSHQRADSTEEEQDPLSETVLEVISVASELLLEEFIDHCCESVHIDGSLQLVALTKVLHTQQIQYLFIVVSKAESSSN